MDKFVIEGGRPLKGEVKISGAKNAVLPILAATLLTDEPCLIKNAPNLRDTKSMLKLLNALGKATEFKNGQIKIESRNSNKHVADYKLVSTMRASFCVLGPLVAKLKRADVALPGGCVIGVRPVDLHLKGLSALGANIHILGGYVMARAQQLKGSHIYLGGVYGSSVLATENIVMAATLAQGKTIIESAACEPEVEDLVNFLNSMGAKITGQGTPRIEIEGVEELHGSQYSVIPDRIEAGTFMIAAAITRGDVTLKGACWEHLIAVIDKLREIGIEIKRLEDGIRVACSKSLKPTNITALPYPGFPTDMQAQFMALMAITPGISVVTEKIYPDRFMHVAELNRMGAHIIREGNNAIVNGVESLSGAPVMASDLRASAALILAGLAAYGNTEISRIYHIERGYEDIDEKLKKIGAKVWREKQ
jgi:UDP-N-acetylglucosamine 1-carboxyvinyltransferase